MASRISSAPVSDQGVADAFVQTLVSAENDMSPAARALAPYVFAKALPDDLAAIETAQAIAMIERMAAALDVRTAGQAKIEISSFGEGAASARRMSLVIVNDDMPFLVDSVTQLITARGLTIHHLIHPILKVDRGSDGRLLQLAANGQGESLMYIETDRLPAKARQELAREIDQALQAVRQAVQDWQAMRSAVQQLPTTGEDKAFLDWVAADNMTLLGFAVRDQSGALTNPLGLFKLPGFSLWSSQAPTSRNLTILKADRISPVHRRVLLDVIDVQLDSTRSAVIAGLFTSASYAEHVTDVPLVRQKIEHVIATCGYDPRSHAGKALAHVLEIFPRDELYQITPEALQRFALRMVSLTERRFSYALTLKIALPQFLSICPATIIVRNCARKSAYGWRVALAASSRAMPLSFSMMCWHAPIMWLRTRR
jgi:glutamate dehydrogenase